MKTLLTRLIAAIVTRGRLEITFADQETKSFGNGCGPLIGVAFHDARAPFDLLRNPELALGELYTDGRMTMTSGSVYELLTLIAENAVRAKPPAFMKIIRHGRDVIDAATLRNERSRSRANVAHHYDLGEKLYALFLDADWQYSCAYFERSDMSLDEAQLAKKRHIAAKLCLSPGQSVLDIGCGWGGMALYLARYCGVRVTGVTLSEEQLARATARAKGQNFGDMVQFRLEDYRDTAGPFDRIVSVGMFEHVGPRHFLDYFQSVAALLNDDGVALIHTIGRPDGPGATNPWISKYIFPGGYIPSLSEIAAAVEKAGLYIADVEVLRLHYADTLREWRQRFLGHRAEAAALYDERFCRMWEFYFSLCEMAFRTEGECVYQVQLAKKHDGVPITRGYIAECEARLRQAEAQSLAPFFAASSVTPASIKPT